MGKFLNAKNSTSLRFNSETMCLLFKGFRYQKLVWQNTEIIGLEKLSTTFDKGILLNQQ